MSRRKTLAEHLLPLPAEIHRDMLENRESLVPGAAAVMGRFFAVVKERREPFEAPSADSFRTAAGSESTLATLLRALARHAPHVSTATARVVRAEYYAQRPRKASTADRPAASEHSVIASWPASWQSMYPSLRAARIRGSSRKRYVASISRCAQLVRAGAADDCLTFYTAWCLSEAFKAGDRDIKPITIANYLEGLVALGRYGGVADESLDGLRYMRDALRDEARLGEKRKTAPIIDLMRRGGWRQFGGDKA